MTYLPKTTAAIEKLARETNLTPEQMATLDHYLTVGLAEAAGTLIFDAVKSQNPSRRTTNWRAAGRGSKVPAKVTPIARPGYP